MAFNQSPIAAGFDNLTSDPVRFHATIVALNSNGDCAFFDATKATSLGSNLSSDASCEFNDPTDRENASPNLGPLANNGGSSSTHALLPGSPAIDGVQGACGSATDQRGVSRPQDGDGSGSPACDIGAYERSPGTLQFSAPTFSVAESGVAAVVTVTRTGGSDGAVGATVSPGNGTATAPADYDQTARSVSFADGDATSKTVQIPIVNDALDEPDETVNLTLGSPTGGTTIGAQGTAVLTIQDDDPTPALSIDDVQVTEGNAGAVNAVFTVTLSAASGQQVTVQAQSADGTATTASGDYTVVPLTTLTFVPGETSKTVTVQVQGDTTNEPHETFVVNLSGASNATIADGQGLGTILDDDALTVTIGDVTVTEGNAGTTNAIFTVRLSRASSQAVTVVAQTADGTATAIGGDYTPTGPTILTFAPTVTTQTFTVPVLGDTADELNETFAVNLSGAVNATIADSQGVGTILDDDGAPTLSIDDVRVLEGNVGTVNATFTVRLSAVSGQPVTVVAQTANGTALAGQDFTAVGPVGLTFPPGTTSQTVSVPVSGDGDQEPDETFVVSLSAPTNATIADNQGLGTIVNDDAAQTQPKPNDDDDKQPKETEEQSLQRERTNAGSKDDVYTEGNVVEVHQDAQPPYVLIGNRDGPVKVVLLCGDQCPTIRVGDYLEADGEKVHEQLFEATDVTIR